MSMPETSAMTTRISLTVLLIAAISLAAGAQQSNAHRPSNAFDRGLWLSFFHSTREMLFTMINSTAATIVPHQYQPPIETPFPCDTAQLTSAAVPQSVHRLRPGDIRVIAAIGDSLTVGSGATATTLSELLMECRGMSWSAGGQWTWRNATTLPNILRAIQPRLVGWSRGNALPQHVDAQLNLAEIGAASADMPAMTRALVRRIRADGRIDFRHDWKVVTALIGGNDVCTFVCMMGEPDALPEQHRWNLVKSLRYMRDYLPRWVGGSFKLFGFLKHYSIYKM